MGGGGARPLPHCGYSKVAMRTRTRVLLRVTLAIPAPPPAAPRRSGAIRVGIQRGTVTTKRLAPMHLRRL